jgi:SAM-dependent methyltransferase
MTDAHAERGLEESPSWRMLSDDPNDPTVLQRRRQQVRRTRRLPVARRNDYLVAIATDKSVLDVGALDHRAEMVDSPAWLHARLASVASRCVAVDIIHAGVERLRDAGYEAVLWDITKGPLDDHFDVIVAGEILEHLGDPVSLFQAARSMLAPGGSLVLSTPNPFAAHRVLRAWRLATRDSADHVALYAPGNIVEICERTGFELTAWRGEHLRRQPSIRGTAQASARWVLGRLFTADVSCDTIIYECRSA